jgi:membrane protease YdiL (CAAX protease family)
MSEKYKIHIYRLILIFLLGFRLFGQHIFDMIVNDQTKPILQSLNLTIIFLLILLALWINKSRLHELNLDQTAYVLLLIAVVLLGWHFVPFVFGAFLLAAVAAIIIVGRNESFQFSHPTLLSGRAITALILVLLPIIPPILLSSNSGASLQNFSVIQLALQKANFFGVYFEEFLFRGMLWAYLRSRSLRTVHVIAIQALLFWLAHISSGIDKWIFFWVTLPFISIMLGLLVHRSKSLAACVTTHFLYNCVIGLIDVGG